MATTEIVSESRFHQDIMDLLPKIKAREVILEKDKEEILRLRQAAYLHEGALHARSLELFKDSSDSSESGQTFGLYIEGRLASSIRLHLATPADPTCPAMSVFPDRVRPMLDAGMTVLDPTRFVVDAEFVRQYRKLPYVTIRLAWMACVHFSAAILLATAGARQQSFYRGLFGHHVVSAARPYPPLAEPVSLMALDFQHERERVMRRYPFLRSTEGERNAIFGPADRSGLRGSSKPGESASSTFPFEPGRRAARPIASRPHPAVA